MQVATCQKCNTPLDETGTCVTCRAEADGFLTLSRTGYGAVREMHQRLEAAGLAPEVEQVPPRREEEMKVPLWNLYVAKEEVGPDAAKRMAKRVARAASGNLKNKFLV